MKENKQNLVEKEDSNQRVQSEIGSRIRALWEDSKETQDAFAADLGVTPATLLNYMGGRRKPDTIFLLALRKKTNVCIDWLLTGDKSLQKHNNSVSSFLYPEKRDDCPSCAHLSSRLEIYEIEQHKLVQDFREVSAENRRLWRELGELREKYLVYEEHSEDSEKVLFNKCQLQHSIGSI